MNLRSMFAMWIALATLAGVSLFPRLARAGDSDTPHAKVIKLDSRGQREVHLLNGPPETVSMRSGLVTLEPNQSVGKHSTGAHEEMLVVFEGQGKMLFADGSSLAIEGKHVLYCPPETEHDVRNTGTGILRYVYIVASTR